VALWRRQSVAETCRNELTSFVYIFVYAIVGLIKWFISIRTAWIKSFLATDWRVWKPVAVRFFTLVQTWPGHEVDQPLPSKARGQAWVDVYVCSPAVPVTSCNGVTFNLEIMAGCIEGDMGLRWVSSPLSFKMLV